MGRSLLLHPTNIYYVLLCGVYGAWVSRHGWDRRGFRPQESSSLLRQRRRHTSLREHRQRKGGRVDVSDDQEGNGHLKGGCEQCRVWWEDVGRVAGPGRAVALPHVDLQFVQSTEVPAAVVTGVQPRSTLSEERVSYLSHTVSEDIAWELTLQQKVLCRYRQKPEMSWSIQLCPIRDVRMSPRVNAQSYRFQQNAQAAVHKWLHQDTPICRCECDLHILATPQENQTTLKGSPVLPAAFLRSSDPAINTGPIHVALGPWEEMLLRASTSNSAHAENMEAEDFTATVWVVSVYRAGTWIQGGGTH